MKRFICFAMIFILCCCTFIVSAENSNYFTFSVEVADGKEAIISESGTVNLHFSISATAQSFGKDFTIEKIVNCSTSKNVVSNSVSVEGSKSSYDLGKFNVPMNDSDAGKNVDFEIFWQDNNGQHSLKTSVSIVKANPKVTLKAEISKKTIAPGEAVTINYEVFNVGNVPVKHIIISDSQVSNLKGKSVIFSYKQETELAVGGGIEESVTVKPNGTLTVAPSVTFQYGGKVYEEKIASTVIAVDDQIPTISLSAESYSVTEINGALNFNYSVKNTTSVVLKNIKVYDSDSDSAQVVFSADELQVGNEINGNFSLNITKSGFYKFKVCYTYEGANEVKEISAKTLKAVRLPDEVGISVASVSPQSITAPGEITFKLRIENKANSPLKNVTISEANNLAEKSDVASVISAGSTEASAVFDKNFSVKIPADNTNISFILSYYLDDEEYALKLDYTVKFDSPLATTTPSATQAPMQTAEPIVASNNYTKSNMTWIIVGSILLFAIGCAIVLLFILRGNISVLAPIPNVKRYTAEIFDNSEEGTLFDTSDDATEDEDVKIFNKNE